MPVYVCSIQWCNFRPLWAPQTLRKDLHCLQVLKKLFAICGIFIGSCCNQAACLSAVSIVAINFSRPKNKTNKYQDMINGYH